MIQIYSSKINISQEQIEIEAKNIINNQKENIEFKLAEIEMDFDKNSKLKLINEIKESIKNDGFSNTASKFSIASTSLTGGEIGWVNINSINNNLLSKIKNLKVGEISEEIIVADKIIILKILDKRKIKNNIDINLVKKNILEEKRNELFNLYSNSHLSKKKNNTLIKNPMNKIICLVAGDPNSINSEIILKSWKKIRSENKKKIILIANYELIR